MSIEIIERPRFVIDFKNGPRRRWLRWVTQFSLRTMLILTAVVAIGCWWFLQPEWSEEEFAGGKLKLWRQMRTNTVDVVGIASPGGGNGTVPGPNAVLVKDIEPGLVLDGAWRLSDENDGLLVAGRYADDKPHGKWAIYHANGRKAAEGVVQRGTRTGVWRTWHENGKLASEVTYRAVFVPGAVIPRSRQPSDEHWYPLSDGSTPYLLCPVGPGAPLFQFGGAGMDAGSMRGTGMFYASSHPTAWTKPRYQSQRHGPAKVWYASGRLRYEGEYQDDLRDGVWTYYGEQGNVVERGKYVKDLREGVWDIRGPHGIEQVRYTNGRTAAEQSAIVARIREGLASDELRPRLAAVDRAEQLGPDGAVLLAEALAQPNTSDELKILALRRLTRMGAVPAAALPSIELLVDHAEPRLADLAMLAVYQADLSRRSALYSKLLAKLEKVDRLDQRREALELMIACDVERRPILLLESIQFLAKHQPLEFGPILLGGPEAISVLVQAYSSADPDVRLYVLGALEQIIEHVPPETPPDSEGKAFWTVPEAVKTIIERGRQDPDPDIRVQASEIGVCDAGSGFGPTGGMGGMGGGGGFF